MCTAPSVKWDAGSSAVPRLTLVPSLEETGSFAKFESIEGSHNDFSFAASGPPAVRLLGYPAPSSPASFRRIGNKWKSNGPPGTLVTSSKWNFVITSA
ncbi:unnamed protein product [Hydatigera taeniaeformis]|uniref:Uncharacterized protein n=1 Tax=Hydatigena taeniaeformis TaxID=6205 RepID=A0A0R3WXD3_HYDTA|nr:unnamed protein product [Hydatigera taeniaeformis]